MPIFSRHNTHILYVHVPKTGGTSIEKFFDANGFTTTYLDRSIHPDSLNGVRRCSPQHMTAAQLDTIFDLTAFRYIFMTVRHPLDRLASVFRGREGQGVRRRYTDFHAWLVDSLEEYEEYPYVFDNHMRPMTEYHILGAETHHLEHGFSAHWVTHLSSRIGMTLQGIPSREMVSGPVDVSSESRALIQEVYAGDFEGFRYD